MPKLREIREAQRMTRQALAEQTGLNYSFLWRVENGTSGVGYVAARAISSGLSVPVEALTGEAPANASL